MEGRWCSAAEVVADVSRAGGGAAPRSLAGACLAWSARPSPLILTEDEEQASPAAERAAPSAPPDLLGITRMLRMVQTEDTDEDTTTAPCDIVISKLASAQPASTDSKDMNANDVPPHKIITTSHLNPDVAEFVPRSAALAPPGPSAGGGDARAREELAAELRRDISGDRDTCSAIARLMRLYAQHPPAPPSAPRLLTPDYFERPAAPQPRTHDARLKENTSRSIETSPEPILSVGSHCAPPKMNDSEPGGAGEPEAEAGADPREVLASVDKVRRWLSDGEDGSPHPSVRASSSGPSSRASPLLLSGPVRFRARAPASPSSPARTPPPPAPAAPARAYEPSRAAAALHREYVARAARAQAEAPAAAAAAAEDTLWTRLEAQLRQKDAELRARAAAAEP